MKNIRWVLLLAVTFIFFTLPNTVHAKKTSNHSSPSAVQAENYLRGILPKHNLRYPTFKTVLQLMEQKNVRTIVETGTCRGGLGNFEGDGGSSVIFSKYAHDHGVQFFSVDIDANALENARCAVDQVLGSVNPILHFVEHDSIGFLRDFPGQIDVLYLDSYDFESNNPTPSQQHHLREIEAAYPHLTSNSIVMIDDCDLPHGGKGLLVIDFLKQRGWKVVMSKYQVILVHG